MRFLFLLLLTLIYASANAQNKIVADISNFRNNAGVCRVCLYDSPSSFTEKGGKPYQCIESKVSDKKVTAVFKKVPDGTYAVMVIHDANNNKKMDTKLMGIPSEGYGASKNKLPFAAAPRFSENSFTVKNNSVVNLSIRLRNL